MKTTALRLITAISAAAAAIELLHVPSLSTVIPDQYSGVLAGIALGALALKEVARVLGDWLDDGERNDSFGN